MDQLLYVVGYKQDCLTLIDYSPHAQTLMFCFRNNLLIGYGFKCLTRPLDFVQDLLSLCVPNVSGRLSIA